MSSTICISAVPRTVRTGYGPDEADTVSARLVAATVAAEATPIVLPVVTPAHARTQLEGAAGLILSGGQDLDLGGGIPSDDDRWIDPARDRHEFALWAAARSRRIPVFGICRGMQLANVALGGTLIDDLPGHDAGPDRDVATHEVTCAPRSELSRAVAAATCVVNTIHHQAVGRLGRDLIATAWAPDGSIEALEAITGSWFAGVQWHPELMLGEAAGQPLFDAFVAACERRPVATRVAGRSA